MKLYIKYDINLACKIIVQEHLEKLNINYKLLNYGELDIQGEISEDTLTIFQGFLEKYGIQIINNQKTQLVQRIKDTIIEMIYEKDKLPLPTVSNYLANKLNLNYGHIANIFSEYTHTSVENFIIIQKIERAKKLIIEDGLTLTEVSYKLNYSSVSYLSTQFKKVTGLTPSAFKRIIDKRRSLAQINNV